MDRDMTSFFFIVVLAGGRANEDTYIISMSLLCSVLIFVDGEIAFIDALFFGAGACTQAGLNTINVNALHTWQQVSHALSA
jgi:hypothetical protein